MTFQIIPAIDILKGKLVRLTKGDYTQIQHYKKNPIEIGKTFEEEGAKRIHIVDLDGAKEGKLINKDLLIKIRQNLHCELEIGGGIRTLDTAKQLFDIGYDYIILGSLLVSEPRLATKIIEKYPNKVIAGIDTKNKQIATEGWIKTSTQSLDEIIHELNKLPLESLIHTDINKDGTLSGPNFDELLEICQKSSHKIIASGGVKNSHDVEKLKEYEEKGIKGCIIGKALLSEKIQLNTLWD